MKDKIKSNINFLYEVGSLRNVRRLWCQVLGDGVQNNLEHSFRVMILALLISRMERKGNEDKIMKIVLFHDLCESRSTDIAFLHREYVERHEEKASRDQLKDTVFENIEELLSEYKERKSIESRIVKDADDLEVDMELNELSLLGNKVADGFIKKNRPKIRERLYTASAKKLWDQIYTTRPDLWQSEITHTWAKNRKKNNKK